MHENGPGSSPVLHENHLILHMDGSDKQYVLALDKQRRNRMADYPQWTSLIIIHN